MQWYRKQDMRCELFGVFEGGGAKGVAFAGALKALANEHWWFHSVGGASAGAITAALVASGIHPEEITSATIDILKRLDASKGLGRLIHEGEYFRASEVRDWLIEMINKLAGLYEPSFKQLRDETGIHLDVVATNLSTRSLIVFSADDTPACSVVDAVASSCAIPFAFSDGVLVCPYEGEEWSQAIVDGGVWANFPLFLYTDEHFRHYYDRVPQTVNQNRLIGLVLDEQQPVAEGMHDEPLPIKLQRSSKIKFGSRWRVFGRTETNIKMWEHRAPKATQASTDESDPARFERAIQNAISWPLGMLASLGAEMGFGEAGWLEDARCPRPESVPKRRAVEFVNGGLSALGSRVYGVPAIALIMGSTCYTMGLTWILVFQLFHSALGAMRWVWGFVMLGFIGVTIAALIALVFIAASATFVFVFQCPIRRVLWGVLSTYVAASGAPEWYRCNPAVVYLPVGGIGTHDFNMTAELRELVECRALDVTWRWAKERLPS